MRCYRPVASLFAAVLVYAAGFGLAFGVHAVAGVIADAVPPARYQENRSAHVVTVDPDRIGDVCGSMMGMKLPSDKRWAGCTSHGLVYVPNPCASPSETFAALLCHELAHAQGWSREHPGR